MWPRLKSWTRHHMWDEIFLLACKCRHIFCCRFSPGKKVRSDYWKYVYFCRLFFSRHLVFPSPQKLPCFPNSSLIRDVVDKETLCGFTLYMYYFYRCLFYFKSINYSYIMILPCKHRISLYLP